MLIGISGTALAGKDTFFGLLKAYLINKDVRRFAFADELKCELDPMFKAFGATAFEIDPIKKALIRPILVAYGCSQRILSDGRYWIDKIEPSIIQSLSDGEIPVICDVRFGNELEWVKSLKGKVIYLERIDRDGNVIKPINEEEKLNDPILRANADILVTWPTCDDTDSLWRYIEEAVNQIKFV